MLEGRHVERWTYCRRLRVSSGADNGSSAWRPRLNEPLAADGELGMAAAVLFISTG
jgi:hypothetical protein